MFSLFEWRRSEVIFVVAVLVAILAISQIQLRIGQIKARDAQRKADVELVGRAIDDYHRDHDKFPLAKDGQIVACGDLADLACTWGGGPLRDAEGVVYLKALPTDPLAAQGRKYVYEVDAKLQHYRIYVALEYRRDVAWKDNLTTSCSNSIQCNWYVGN